MPVSVWRALIDLHYPHTGWIRLHHDTIDALVDYKARHALLGLDDTVMELLTAHAAQDHR